MAGERINGLVTAPLLPLYNHTPTHPPGGDLLNRFKNSVSPERLLISIGTISALLPSALVYYGAASIANGSMEVPTGVVVIVVGALGASVGCGLIGCGLWAFCNSRTPRN